MVNFDPDRTQVPEHCPVSGDKLDATSAGWHCRSCNTPVVNVSQLTREEASEFLGRTQGQPMCIGLEVDADGRNLYAPPRSIVPGARLLRVVGSATLAAALAACTASGPDAGQNKATPAEPEVKPAEPTPTPVVADPEEPTTVNPEVEAGPEPEPKPNTEDAGETGEAEDKPVVHIKKGKRTDMSLE